MMERTDYNLNIDLPYFFGHMHVEEYLDWLNFTKTFLDYSKVPDGKRVKLVAYKLRSGALSLMR